MIADMTLRGWNDSALARASQLSVMTVKTFLDGSRQTAKTADKLAQALGYTVKRYLLGVANVA
jgi:plasmid maintenance system antidote protein VapI